MSITAFLKDTEEIWRRTQGDKNEYGEATDTWAQITTLLGTIQPKGGTLDRVDNGIAITYDGILYCLITANVQVGDKVRDPSGKFWNVLYVNDESGRGHHYKVMLKGIE